MPEHSGFPINATTRCCAVFGHPIHHSASPAMHNAAFAELGLNNRYLAFDVHPDHLAAALEGARRMRFLGVNLTVPHKLLAVSMMAELDNSAVKWGAVNTVCFEGRGPDGDWKPLREFAFGDEAPLDLRSRGYNTDASGFLASVKHDLGIHIEGARVMLLGAGGAGRVVGLQLAEMKVADLFLINRTPSRAEALATEIAERFPGVHVMIGYAHREVDLIINATSLGLSPEDTLPMDLNRFPLTDTKAVYDMVYRPPETRLLQCAREAGARSVNGLGMLLYQGAKAFELWTGKPAPIEVMRVALRKEVYGHGADV